MMWVFEELLLGMGITLRVCTCALCQQKHYCSQSSFSLSYCKSQRESIVGQTFVQQNEGWARRVELLRT